MEIVGIDASLTGTAWSVGGATGRIATGSLRGTDRLVRIRDEVLQRISDCDLVVLENYSYASAQQAHQIGELGGVLRVAFVENRRPYVVVAPQARAKFATGSGGAGKDQVVSAVSARTGIAFANNDECDAFVLWCMGMEAYGHETLLHPTNAKHREPLTQIQWPHIEWHQSQSSELHSPVVEYLPPKKKKRS